MKGRETYKETDRRTGEEKRERVCEPAKLEKRGKIFRADQAACLLL